MQAQKLIVLKRPEVDPILQIDLEQLMLYTRELHEAEKLWKEKRREIREALRRGAQVEPGVHMAYLEVRSRVSCSCCKSWRRPNAYETLKVS